MKVLNDIFVPTERNGMMPILLRTPAALLFFFAGAILIFSPVYVQERQFASLIEGPLFTKDDVIRFVNASRIEEGLPALVENPVLDAAAGDKARDMAEKGYFSHLSPKNRSPWDFLRSREYRYVAAGENLASDFVTAREVHEALMDSTSHRANILNRLYTEVGVAVTGGTLEGRPTIFVVQYFGKPKVTVTKAPVATGVTPPKPPTPSRPTAAPTPLPSAAAPVTPSAQESVAVEEPNPSVLGITEESKILSLAIRIARESILSFTREFDVEALLAVPGKVFAFGVIGVLVIALFLFVSRMHTFPLRAAFRVLVLVIMFGYIGIQGGGDFMSSKITPVSFSTSAIEARQ